MTRERNRLSLLAMLLAIVAAATACRTEGGPLPTVQSATVPPLTAAQATGLPQPTTAPQPTQTAPGSNVGARDNPVQMYFVPSADAAVIVDSGQKIAAFLNQQTGLHFAVQVPPSYAATIEALGGCKGNCIAFIPALGYVLAHDRYGVTVGLAAVRSGLNYYFAVFLVARDSDIKSLKDLNGKKWAVPSRASTSGYLFPLYMMNSQDIQPGEVIEAGGQPQAVLAVYQGTADFATAFFSPPDLPGGKPWTPGDPPEPPLPFKDRPFADEKNNVRIDGWVLKDARVQVFTTAPDIFEKVRILTLTHRIPNDALIFDKDFPQDLRDQIIQGLVDYSQHPEGRRVLSNSRFYAWDGVEPVDDSFYDQVRGMIRLLGLTEKDIFR